MLWAPKHAETTAQALKIHAISFWGLASTQQFPSLIQLNHKHQSLTILLSLQHWARLLAACPGTYSGKNQLPSDQLREE